ncbi:MAG: ATP-dependent DNA helicase RecG [Candidatus Taylorbacteria bacterium]|nr:ATP-dependent DNA helicase RecG [Candidatus Taylorbacteria bacterium]
MIEKKSLGITLNSPVTSVFVRLSPPQKMALSKLGIKTVEDLLYHFPARYGDTAEMQNINSLTKGADAVIFGQIKNLKTSKAFVKKIPMSDGIIEDQAGGRIKCVWFNQPYIAKMISEGAFVRAEGRVAERKGELYLSNPQIEMVTKIPIGVGHSLFEGSNMEDMNHTLYPVYPESRGITSNWIYHAVQRVFKSGLLDTLEDPIPEEILKKYSLPSIKTAFVWIHSPQKQNDADVARKRFAFEEVFFIQIDKQKARVAYKNEPAFMVDPPESSVEEFIKRFPFEATEAQRNAIKTILTDFRKGHAMSRLLEGDVGSGKTAVAASTAHAVVTTRPKGQNYGRLQVAYMCPTEILATQHFESFIKYFSYLNISVALMTGSGCRKFPSKLNPSGWTDISRTQLLKWVENGEIPIVIGTHSLIQKTVKFKNLAYVIIDEQHRFGTAQRAKLVRKDADNLARAPHLLSMTATPIPRTLALTIFGDLDLTLLDQMPHGRKPIITEIVLPGAEAREKAYEKVKLELEAGRQMYIICPRIDEPDPDKEKALNAKSVIEEAKRLKRSVFKEYEIGVLHGKMKPDDKDKVMNEFNAGKIHILCATSVVEVGVNVPNATVIVIEGGERFGLAQLHQLRGRVIRGNHQAYCYVFAESRSAKTVERLKALRTAKNGFELAEYDLQFRGAGELYGSRQWGIRDVAMEALKNIKMVEAARAEALHIVETDFSLENYPQIKAHLEAHKGAIHFE